MVRVSWAAGYQRSGHNCWEAVLAGPVGEQSFEDVHRNIAFRSIVAEEAADA
jgi:hypothetical protein